MNFNQGVIQSNPVEKKDIIHALDQTPTDSISELTWSNEASPNFLSACSWDKSVRIWELQFDMNNNINSIPKIMFQHTAPVLTSCFYTDNSKFFTGGCDNIVKMYDLATGDTNGTQVAMHDQPISKVKWLHAHNLLVTTSWDGNVKIWDLRTNNVVWFRNIQGKIFKMDVKHPYMIISDNHNKLHAYNFAQSLDGPSMQIDSNLNTQTRSLSLFPPSSRDQGVIFGSLEGRCSITFFDEYNLTKKEKSFCFKSNKVEQDKSSASCYAVNAIDFAPNSVDIFLTAGSDGRMDIWNKSARSKLKNFPISPTSITDAKFHTRNNILAYAVSYDWHKGDDPVELQKNINKIYVQVIKDQDLIKK